MWCDEFSSKRVSLKVAQGFVQSAIDLVNHKENVIKSETYK